MFETDKYDRSLHREAAAMPVLPYEPAANIEGMSLLLWGEHCVECAAPACYSSCDLYHARSDSRCRRFSFGAYRNSAFASARGGGIEVRFKKWAKLEAFGNTAIHPLSSTLRWERTLERAAPWVSRIGKLGHRVSGRSNLEQLSYIAMSKLTRAFHRRGRVGPQPTAFLLEIYNPEAQAVRLQVIFSVSLDDLPEPKRLQLVPPITRTVNLPPGYSRHEFEASSFCSIPERGLPFKITMVPEGDSNARLVFLTADLVTFKVGDQLAQSPPIKCLVWDLDNTLWHGTLVEGDELTMRPGLLDLLEHFDRRGILMSIASKNDFAPALEQLKHFGIAEYFLYPQIDWLPKSQKIAHIARQLNIGLDSLAFIDDNQFELDEVAGALPQVMCISGTELERLRAHPRCQGSLTEESRQRRRYYQAQAVRETDQGAFGGDYLGFLKACDIALEISPYQPADGQRVAELVQRTNQLNFSGRKYSRAQLDDVIADRGLDKYVLKCSDQYGSYGTVGFCIAAQQPHQLRIMDFMLSCRVQGKLLERALFAHLLQFHNRPGAAAMWVNFHRTERNTPAFQVLEALGFRPSCNDREPADGLILPDCTGLACDFIRVSCTQEAATSSAA